MQCDFLHHGAISSARGKVKLVDMVASVNKGICEAYADQMGWKLLRANVMVEGFLDVAYFNLAGKLYEATCSLSLLGRDLSIFAAGQGDEGGTFGVVEQFPTLLNLAKRDLTREGKMKYRLAALLDNDQAGRDALRLLCRANRAIQENGLAFLLWRQMPRKSRDQRPLSLHIREANSVYQGLDCEIEDLLDDSICDLYATVSPHHLIRKRTAADGFHYDWTRDGKQGLRLFTAENADSNALSKVIETLKSMRFYLGLPPDGLA